MKQRNHALILAFSLTISFMIVESYAIDAYDAPVPPRGLYFVDYPLFFMANKLKDSKGFTISDKLDLNYYANLFRLNYFNRTTFKNTWVASILIPSGHIEVLGDHDEGLGDVTAVIGYWIIDRPGSKTWLSLAQFIDIPVGHFDKNKSANMGGKRLENQASFLFWKIFFGQDRSGARIKIQYFYRK